MARIVRCVVLLAAAAVLAGCASGSYLADWDAEVDFKAFRTFAWFERAGADRQAQGMSPFLERRIQRAVSAELRTRGLEVAGVDGADLLITAQTSVQHRLVAHHVGYAYPSYWHRGWGWGGSHVSHYTAGTLVLDLVDRTTRRLVWRGVAEGAISRADASEEEIARVVSRLLADLPR